MDGRSSPASCPPRRCFSLASTASPGTSVVDRLFARAVGGTHDKVLRQARCPVLSVRQDTGTGVPEVRSPRR